MGLKSQPLDSAVLDELLTARHSKWNLTVVLHLRRDTKRFSELQREIGNISQKGLTLSLRSLERDGFISRTSYATIPPRVDYALSDLGSSLRQPVKALGLWAFEHHATIERARKAYDQAQD